MKNKKIKRLNSVFVKVRVLSSRFCVSIFAFIIIFILAFKGCAFAVESTVPFVGEGNQEISVLSDSDDDSESSSEEISEIKSEEDTSEFSDEQEIQPEDEEDTDEASPEEEIEDVTEDSSEEDTEVTYEDETSETDSEERSEEESEDNSADEDFDEEDFENFVISVPAWSGYIQSEAEFEEQLYQFPSSYHAGLRAVHEVYPNYTFIADYIDMDFEELVDYHIGKKVDVDDQPSWKAMYDESFGKYENYDWDDKYWYASEGHFTYASREVIEYFMDPRNFLDHKNIFMFMRQSYSDNQTLDDLRSIIEGSFLSEGYVPNKNDPDDVRCGGDYAKVLMEAAQLSGTSPFVLAASILLEHGYRGTTPFVTGNYEADDGTVYKGYYNFYDIGATGSDNDNVICNGLEYAKAAGWNSRYKSIVGGAQWTADSYINTGQDTYYYKEYNVLNGWDYLWHEFSTGALSAYDSAYIMRSAVSDYTYAALEFRIPVYDNMPEIPTELPDYNENLNNYYFLDIQANGLTPSFTMANRNYSLSVKSNTTINVEVPKYATYLGANSYTLKKGNNEINLKVKSQTGFVRTYTLNVNASKNCVLMISFDKNIVKPTSDYVWGDANGDGKTSTLDYITIKNHIMGDKLISDSVNLLAADANQDGKVSTLDYITIKNYIMSK